jgi:2-dehydropantoate 2-reductase
MNIHIMGAGAMGCLWAAHLHCAFANIADHQVSFIDGRESSEQRSSPSTDALSFHFNSPFLAYIPDSSTFNFKLDNASTITEHLDCLLVCTKSYDALSGLKHLSKHISERTILVLFQNGLGSQYDVLQAFPDNPIFAAVTTEGANKVSKVNVIHAGKGLTRIGALSKTAENEALAKKLLSHLQAPSVDEQLSICFEHNIWKALWHKLVINCAINPYTAILDCPNGEVHLSERFKDDWPRLKKELSELLIDAHHPLPENSINRLVMDVMNNTHHNISSMLQDIRTNKRTEIADINGFAARFLKSHQRDHTINSALEKAVLEL